MIKKVIKILFSILGLEVSLKHKGLKRTFWPVQKSIPQVFYEADEDFHSLYDLAQEKTQMTQSDNPLRRQRHYVLMQLLRNVNLSAGSVCEIGAFRGLSAYQISTYLNNENVTFHLFDSFEGLSDINTEDISLSVKINDIALREQFACSEDEVKKNLHEFNFIEYHKGWIPERFPEVKNTTFSFVHIDVDLYQPTYDSIQYFYPRLARNGIMVFDDYGYTNQFPGAKKAVDQGLKEIGNQFFMALPSGQAFLIKDFKA